MASSTTLSDTYSSDPFSQRYYQPGMGATPHMCQESKTAEKSATLHMVLLLEARDLPSLGKIGKPDVYAQVSVSSNEDSESRQWRDIAKTETLYTNENPRWTKNIMVEYHSQMTTVLRFRIFHRVKKGLMESRAPNFDLLGEAQCTVAHIFLDEHFRWECNIRSELQPQVEREGSRLVNQSTPQTVPKLIIRWEEHKGDLQETLKLLFSVNNVSKCRRPFYVLSRLGYCEHDYAPVIYSEVLEKYHRDKGKYFDFKVIERTVSKVVNHDLRRQLKVEIFDFDPNGYHSYCGFVKFSLASVQKRLEDTGVAAIYEIVKENKEGQKTSVGNLWVRRCEIHRPYSFPDYIGAGVRIQTVVSIDLSNSNGNPSDPNSLHYNNSHAPNEYVTAMRQVGDTLQAYSTRTFIPTYGFGAVLQRSKIETCHCFPLSLDSNRPLCRDAEHVVQTYYHALRSIGPFQPCLYVPMLEHILGQVQARGAAATTGLTYTVLFLYTDGEFEDLDKVSDLVCAAADLPLSIVIIGIGNSHFVKLDKLNGSERRLCSSDGTPCSRDIITFFRMHDYRFNVAALQKQILDVIPDQLFSYMRRRNLNPNDVRQSTTQHPPTQFSGPSHVHTP